MNIKEFLEEKILWNLEDFWHSVVDFFRGFKRVFYFLPVIWRDRDWDFDFLLTLIEHKLKSMQNYFLHGEITTRENYSKMVDGINDTLDHIRKYRESSEWYDVECGGCPIDITYETKPSEELKGCVSLVSINSETGKPLTDEEEAVYNKYLKGSFEFEKRQWEAIWECIKKEGESWWD